MAQYPIGNGEIVSSILTPGLPLMKGIELHYPFTNFLGYKQTGKDGRARLYVYNIVTKKGWSMLYSRYIKSVELGRFLSRDEHVDHIDGNKLNDSPDNLQILSRFENLKKLYR